MQEAELDSDVTADSLSSPEHGVDTPGRGFGMLSSFSTQDPPNPMNSHRSGIPFDSFDLSPATDASSGGGGFLSGSRQRPSPREAGGLVTPLSESRQSLDLSHVTGDETTENNSRHHNDVAIGRTGVLGLSCERGSDVVVGVASATTPGGGGVRKRLRDGTTTAGYARGWQTPKHRLESSWPLSRASRPSSQSVGGEEGLWGLSQPSRSVSSSRQGMATRSPREHGVPQVSTSSLQRAGSERGEFLGGFYVGNGAVIDERRERRGSRSEGISVVGGRGGGDGGGSSISGGSTSASSNDVPLSGGIGETLSVSDGSSRGLPAPPIIPSGPLPAIGALREVRQYCQLY